MTLSLCEVYVLDFKSFFDGDHKAFNEDFFQWLVDARNRLDHSWTIEDASLSLVLIEIQFNEGLVSERESDLKQADIFYRSRLKLSDLICFFYGRILTSEHRNELIKNFVIYDHLIQKYERTESANIKHVYEQFKGLVPHLDKFKYELCHLCSYFKRPYRLPQSYWDVYKKQTSYSPMAILLKWLERKKYVAPKNTRSFANDRNQALNYHQLCSFRKQGSQRYRRTMIRLELAWESDEFFYFIEHLKAEILECCCDIEIIERFIILDAWLAIGEEWFLVDQKVYREVFTALKDHLLQAFRLEELEDFIQTFARPYTLLDD